SPSSRSHLPRPTTGLRPARLRRLRRRDRAAGRLADGRLRRRHRHPQLRHREDVRRPRRRRHGLLRRPRLLDGRRRDDARPREPGARRGGVRRRGCAAGERRDGAA
ncbi:proteophosphoglycan ppg4, partial [Fischerella thermalis JSC-11]